MFKDRVAKLDSWAGLAMPEPAQQMIAGGLAGCAIWLPPVYCLDVIKTRMQTAEPGVYSGVGDCAAKTWRWVSSGYLVGIWRVFGDDWGVSGGYMYIFGGV